MNIRSVANGFIIEHKGQTFVAKSLMEAAELVGEANTYISRSYVTYAPGYDISALRTVKMHVQNKNKINAIKELRDIFEPRLSLREAKDIVDEFLW